MKILNSFYCFMLLLIMSTCDASRLNHPSEKIKVKKILSRTNKKPVKSIKSLDGDIIDCVHISDQPAFDHPLLQNHTIQMRPNDYPEGLFGEGKDDIKKPISQLWHLNGRCPQGTIPIRRTTKEDIMRASSIDSFGTKQHKSFFHLPFADELFASGPVHEHAVASTVEGNAYYGAKANINVWNPKIEDPREFSLSQLWIVGGLNSILNTIEVGWIVYPQLLGDYNPRLFVYWTSDGYQNTGCYNLLCSGFVQTNNNMALGGSINPFSTNQDSQIEITILVWKDPKQDSWWLKYGNEDIGYWPASLFQYLTESAEVIQWGGEVTNFQADGQHTATQMGNGNFAEEGSKEASYFRNLTVVDNSNTLTSPGVITGLAERPNCYDVITGKSSDWGDYFFYGGPGRNPNCP